MEQAQKFRVVRIIDGRNKEQVEQFVGMMSKMYDYHAGLHPDWQQKQGWQKGSGNWIRNAAGGNEWFFGLVYPEPEQALQPAVGYIIAGFHYEAPLFVQNRYGYIADMWIEPEYRGQGAADVLLQTALDFLKEQGASRVQLEVMVNNEPGKRFWQKAGFEPFEMVMRKDI